MSAPATAQIKTFRPDGTLAVSAPLAVERPESADWNRVCDVLVIGFGAAGAATAIRAREAGAEVLIVDRFFGGGASAKSGGVVYAGGGTPHQIAAGYDDTPEAMAAYLQREVGDAVSPATVQKFSRDSVGLLAWLERMGASFNSSAPPPKTSYPRDGIYLYYSGNEGLDDYAAVAKPAPRGHRMVDKGLSGKALFAVLRRRVESLSIPTLNQSSVRRLITDGSGTVLGAEVAQLLPGSPAAKKHARLIRWAENVHNFAPGLADKWRAEATALELAEAKVLRVRAKRGVVLATGGFIFNRPMVAEHAPKYLKTMRLGATGCDGSGIRLGVSVGGVAARMDRVSAWRFINPPLPWAKALAVNAKGERFCNEQSYGAKLGVEMCEHHEGRAWLILDARLRKQAIREALFGRLWAFQSIPALILMWRSPKAATVEQLAERMGMPPAALRNTIETYNAAANGGVDAFHKSASMMQPLTTGPFWALDISASNKTFPCPAITLGGLKVDEASGAVLGAGGAAIPGLYAAGRAAVGLASNYYVSGLSLADCLWSGQRAAQSLSIKI